SASPVEGAEWDKHNLPQVTGQQGFAGFVANIITNREQAGQYLWHLDRLLAGEPNNAEYHPFRGRYLAVRRDFAPGEAAMTRAIELKSSESRELYRYRADVRAELGKWKEAEADLVEYIKQRAKTGSTTGLFLNVNTAHGTLAMIRLQLGNLDGYKAAF